MEMKSETRGVSEKRIGVGYALAAYGTWGLLPLFWKTLNEVPAVQILAHRFFWSFVYVGILITITKQKGKVKEVLLAPKTLLLFLTSSLLLTANWGIYIWANNNNHIIETSLGYFINPLVSVLLGMIFLKEKINFWQALSVFLAALGVLYMVFQYGRFPWISLALAVSFGFYGLIRKVVPVESLTGLLIETGFLAPVALIFIVLLGVEGKGFFFTGGIKVSFLLMIAGVITAYPLIWLVNGAKKLPLKTVGFCQYLAPTLMLLIGVGVYHEPLTEMHLVSFAFIWSALLIYSLSNTSFMQKGNPLAIIIERRGRM
ncbi:MAG: EamA family transporter RarD [Dehalobacterium sp.]